MRGVYAIRNIISKRAYIGSAEDIASRWTQHLWGLRHGRHHSIKLQRAWDRDGQEAFEMVVLQEVADGLLAPVEQRWLDELGHYNILPTAYSTKGAKKSPETIRRHRDAALKSGTDPAVRERRSAAQKARFADPEKRQRHKDGLRKFYGSDASKEKNRKVSEARKGPRQPLTAEWRAKIAVSTRAALADPAVRKKMSESATRLHARRRQESEK